MKKPGKKRIEKLVEQVSFATSWTEVSEGIVRDTYLYKLLISLQEAEREFEKALEDEMDEHEVEYS